MGLDKKFIAESYKAMSDDELLYIVSNDYNDLVLQAREALQEELLSRGLGEGIGDAIEMQTKDLPEEILKEYIELIGNMPCPLCSTTGKKLNAIIVVKGKYRDFIIACPECLHKELGNAQAVSMGTGIFGGISGMARAVNQTVMYSTYTKQLNRNEPTDALIDFIKKRIGQLKLY